MSNLLPFGTDICQCPTCAELFNSTAAFDAHRTGRHGIDRRCRTYDEMIARGMVRNARGRWITKARETAPEPQGEAIAPGEG